MPEPFTPGIATGLIREDPGRTDKEIVTDALEQGLSAVEGAIPWPAKVELW